MDPDSKGPKGRRPAARRAAAKPVTEPEVTGTGRPSKPRPSARPAPSEAASSSKSRKRRSSGSAPRKATENTDVVKPAVNVDLAPVTAEPSNVQAHLYEIQRNLDRLLRDVHRAGGDAESRRRAAEALNKIAYQLGGEGDERVPVSQAFSLRRALSADHLTRRLSRVAMRHRADEVDEFGLDRTYEAHIRPLLDTLYDKYFRVHAEGLQHIPRTGRALLVCNRGGALPLDGIMLKAAVARASENARELRWLIEDFSFHAPFLGPFLNRIGAVRACQENAQRLLRQEALLAVFPEGIKGVSKLYSKRYQLQRFGRGGYIKLALRTGAPIIPVAVVGPEDAYPVLYRLSSLAKGLGIPFLPLTPTFPWLGPAGLIPLPSRFVILAGPPVSGLDDHGPEAAEEPTVVNELNERVRSAIQNLLGEAQALRGDHIYA